MIHVVDSLDNDIAEANRAGISDAIEKRSAATPLSPDVKWDLHLVGEQPGVGDGRVGDPPQDRRDRSPSSLVIGARRRSPVGKAFLGSVTQDILLDADVPVLVVKSPR